MTVKLIGPYWLADAQRPGRGAPHPDYPMMFVVSSSTIIKEGALGEITINYAGRTDTNGGTNFLSETLESASIAEGELTYGVYSAVPVSTISQTITSTDPTFPGGQAVPLTTWKCSVNSFAIRYASLNRSFKYVTNYKPNGPSLGTSSVLWQYTRFVGQGSPVYITQAGIQSPSPQQANLPVTGFKSDIRPTGWTSQQVIGPWWENTETWSFRYENVENVASF